MFKYFKHKPIKILFEYNDSMGYSWVREYCGVYDSIEFIGENYWFSVVLKNKGGWVFEEDFEVSAWYFIGFGRLRMHNGGRPCCCLTMSFL
jgi:hypothetical protein